MANDVASDIEYQPMAGFSVSLSGDDADLLRGYWEKLSAGGTITMPMQNRSGAMSSACASTGSASRGWSISASRRPRQLRDTGQVVAAVQQAKRDSSPASERRT